MYVSDMLSLGAECSWEGHIAFIMLPRDMLKTVVSDLDTRHVQKHLSMWAKSLYLNIT